MVDTSDETRGVLSLELCMLGQDYEALYYCVVAAARQLVFYYDSDAQAKELCESLMSADLRAVCLQRTEEQTAKQRYGQESALKRTATDHTRRDGFPGLEPAAP